MSEPISVGDLVYVARPRKCGCTHNLGLVFRVAKLLQVLEGEMGKCRGCGERYRAKGGSWMARGNEMNYAIGLFRLRRIPPLSELEGEKRDEEIVA